MGCGQAKHAVHSPVLGELASTRVSQTTALPEQETTPAETIPLDATTVAAEVAAVGAPAAPVGPRIQLQLVDFRPLAVPSRRSAETSLRPWEKKTKQTCNARESYHASLTLGGVGRRRSSPPPLCQTLVGRPRRRRRSTPWSARRPQALRQRCPRSRMHRVADC